MKRTDMIGAAEAEAILRIKRCLLHTLIRDGRLPAKLIEHDGPRHYLFKRADVLAINARGGARKYKTPRRWKRLALWERYFGSIPEGYTPHFRDGNKRNMAPGNLCLVAKASLWTPDAKGQRRRAKRSRQPWSKSMLAKLKREYSTRISHELAAEMGVSTAALNRQARRHKLRKNFDIVRAHLRKTCAFPLGAERENGHTDIIYVKVSTEGTAREQWRPKHHVVWEKANGKRVPPNYRVIFKDGNRRNYDPANLVAMTRNEASALANLQFHSKSKEARQTIRLVSRLKREAERQMFGGEMAPRNVTVKSNKGGARKGERRGRWTPEMDRILHRDYPSKMRWDVAASLGVTELAARLRAKRLMIQRQPQTLLAEARARAAAKNSLRTC